MDTVITLYNNIWHLGITSQNEPIISTLIANSYISPVMSVDAPPKYNKKGYMFYKAPALFVLFSLSKYFDQDALASEEYQNALLALNKYSQVKLSDDEKPITHRVPGLFPHQEVAVKTMYNNITSKYASILADEQGLGKTASTIALISAMFIKKLTSLVVVVCPVHLVGVWERELERLPYNFNVIPILKTTTRLPSINENNEKLNIIILTYSGLARREGLFSQEFEEMCLNQNALLVFDEAHYVKNQTTITHKAIKELSSAVKYRVALTGTPYSNTVMDIIAIYNILFPVVVNSPLLDSRCARPLLSSYFQSQIRIALPRNTAVRNVDKYFASELVSSLIKTNIVVRRLKKQVFENMPPKLYSMVVLASSRDYYGTVYDMAEIVPERVVAGKDFVSKRRLLTLKMIHYASEFVLQTQIGCSSKKVVVFAYHKDVIMALRDSILTSDKGANLYFITGDVSAKEKQRVVDEFQLNDGPAILIGQIRAASTGITLTASSNVIFVESDWTASTMEQACDRVHRIGQKETVNIYFLTFPNSPEQYVIRTFLQKYKATSKILSFEQEPSLLTKINN